MSSLGEKRVAAQPQMDPARAGRAAARASHGTFNPPPGEPVPDPFSFDKPRDPHWYKHALFYEVLVRGFHDSNGDGTGDLRGPDLPAGLPAMARHRLHLAAAHLRLAAAGRRLRHLRLHLDPAGVRDPRATSWTWWTRPTSAGMRVIADLVMNHTSDAAPLVPGVPQPTPTGRTATSTSGRTRDERLPRGAGHLRRHRAVELDLRPGPRPVLLAPVLLPPARPQLREPAGPGRHARGAAVLARPRHRRVPPGRGALPVRARGHQLREPQGDPRVPEADPGRDRPALPGPGAARRGQPVAGRRGGVLRRHLGGRGRMPHGLPLPADAAHLHGGPPGAALPDLGDHGADPADPGRAASGASSCATTTS